MTPEKFSIGFRSGLHVDQFREIRFVTSNFKQPNILIILMKTSTNISLSIPTFLTCYFYVNLFS